MKPPHLSPFTEAGALVFLSGQLAMGGDGKLVEGGLIAQTSQVLANIEAVLAPLGLTRADIVKTTVWLKPGVQFAAFNDVYAEFFGEHRPARSTVYGDLMLPTADVEIEAIALRRS